ncbi:MAG: nitrilase-related carbon-nitrogen hydrolase [bacterium]
MKWKTSRTWHGSLVWLMLSGAAVALSSGRISLALPAWLVPFFALRFIQTSPYLLRKRLTRLFLIFWVALSATWYGATPLWGLPHFVFMAVNAGFTLLPYAAYTILRRHLPPSFLSTLIFPAAVVAVEWLTILGSPFGSFGAGAYSQYGVLPLLQLLSIGGVLALTFLMAWTGAVAEWALQAHRAGRRWIVPAAVWAMVMIVVFAWGLVQLQSDAASSEGSGDASTEGAAPVSVMGLTAQEVSMHELMPLLEEDPAAFRGRTAEIHRDYLETSESAARNGVDLLVWPELAGVGTISDVEALTDRAAKIAGRHGIWMVVPTMALDPTGAQQAVNRAVLLGPNGSTLAEHVKFGGNFMEGTLPGDRQITVADTAIGRIGLAICWDADFPEVVSQAGRESVDILVVPAADWSGIDPLHGRMALFRAVENGTTLLRQAQGGLSIVADPYGRVLDRGSGPRNEVRAVVSPASVPTIYPRIGNILGPVSAAFVLLTALLVILRKRKVAPAVAAASL